MQPSKEEGKKRRAPRRPAKYSYRPTWNRQVLRYVFINRLPFVMYDTETTGTSPERDRVIQFAGIRYAFDKDGCLVEDGRVVTYIDQPVKISPGASRENGITSRDLEGAPSEPEAFEAIAALFGSRPIACGYNVLAFDNAMIAEMYARNGAEFRPVATLDVSELVRDFVPAERDRGRTQAEMAALYGVDGGIKFHDAAADIEACRRLLLCMVEEDAKAPWRGKIPIFPQAVWWFPKKPAPDGADPGEAEPKNPGSDDAEASGEAEPRNLGPDGTDASGEAEPKSLGSDGAEASEEAEPKNPDPDSSSASGKKKPQHSRGQHGIYVRTNAFLPDKKTGKAQAVTVWYSTTDKCWYSGRIDFSEYDMDRFTVAVLRMLGYRASGLQTALEAMSDFGRLSERKLGDRLRKVREMERGQAAEGGAT